jgi:hypothetical protein
METTAYQQAESVPGGNAISIWLIWCDGVVRYESGTVKKCYKLASFKLFETTIKHCSSKTVASLFLTLGSFFSSIIAAANN